MAAPVHLLAAVGCWLAVAPLARALIIPQELPTILSVLYSNIPPILKGTDSRIGLGFRFGPHADFQVQLELGPQLYTQRLGPEQEVKRRRQAARPPVGDPAPPVAVSDATAPASLGSSWLSAWRSGLVNPSQNTLNAEQVMQKNTSPLEENDVVSHLTSLYKNAENDTSSV